MKLRYFALLIIAIFIISALYGYFTTSKEAEGLNVFEVYKVVIDKDPTLISFALIIFLNNVKVAILSIILGPTLIVPVAIMAFNGVILGQAIAVNTAQGMPLTNILLLILPHGVIELTAFVLSNSIGLYLGIQSLRKYVLRRREISLINELYGLMKYIKITLILLVIAALIEAYVTYAIALLLNALK